MRMEDLKVCLREAKREKDQERRRWDILVRPMQVMFGYGTVPEEIAWATMFLLTKGKRG